MAKFIELNEAAKLLSVNPDKLVEMRDRGEIRGFRDGSSWKFKQDEIDRVLAERGPADEEPASSAAEEEPDSTVQQGQTDSGGAEPQDAAAQSDVEMTADDSILVSEEELGQSGESSPGAIIGKAGQAEPAESDLALSTTDDEASPEQQPMSSDSDVRLAPSPGADSDVALVSDAGLDSDATLVPDPGSDGAMSGSSDPDDLELQTDSTGGSDDLELESGSDTGSGDDLGLDDDLALSEDDDILLSGSGTGSDLSLGAGDSGINLGTPSDSGLSLEADSGVSLQTPTDSGLSLEEQEVEAGGGSSASSLELGEDSEESKDEVGLADSGEVQQDEQFMLAPSDESDPEEGDSGSQVIALEDSEAFAADELGVDDGQQALVAEEGGLEGQLDTMGGAAPMQAGGPGYAGFGELPEAPYSTWNIMGLAAILLFLALSGILMTDIVRNMWAWEAGRDMTSSISEGITSAFGL